MPDNFLTPRKSSSGGRIFVAKEVNGGGSGGLGPISISYKLTSGEAINIDVNAEIKGSPTPPPPPPPIEENCLIFSQPRNVGGFSITVKDYTKHWDGTLEYSIDGATWIEWDGNTIMSGDFPEREVSELRIRGIGNTYITGYASSEVAWCINSMDSAVICTGNIETLLDYQTVANGEHPTMANYAFTCLFNDPNSKLVIPPSHRGIVTSDECYRSMYSTCSHLKGIPALYATNIDSFGPYQYMIDECSSIKISETKTDECPNEYIIPIQGTGTVTGSEWNYCMFSDTSGTFTGDPQINTTYYTNATVIY